MNEQLLYEEYSIQCEEHEAQGSEIVIQVCDYKIAIETVLELDLYVNHMWCWLSP